MDIVKEREGDAYKVRYLGKEGKKTAANDVIKNGCNQWKLMQRKTKVCGQLLQKRFKEIKKKCCGAKFYRKQGDVLE